MCLYLDTKVQVSSVILTGIIFGYKQPDSETWSVNKI